MYVSFVEWLWFVIALISAMVIPGPGVFATVAFSLKLGFKRSLAFVIGAGLGDLTFLWIALLGLGIFLQTASLMLLIVLAIAALYFANMSFKLFRAAFAVQQSDVTGEEQISKGLSGWFSTFLSGYSITITNPKVVIFYLGILPAFLDVSEFGAFDYLAISLITPISLFFVLGSYAYAADMAKALFKSASFNKTINLISGTVFGLVSLILFLRLFAIAKDFIG